MNPHLRNALIWVVIGVALAALFFISRQIGEVDARSIDYSEFVKRVEMGEIVSIEVSGETVEGFFADGEAFVTEAQDDAQFYRELAQKDVAVRFINDRGGVGNLVGIVLNFLPFLLIVGIWIYVIRQMQVNGRGAMGFGRSKARLLEDGQVRVTFKDVAGVDEAKDDLFEIVDFLRDARKFQRLGGRIPRGLLLVGPPGTGKTLLARAIAGEAEVPFFTISGSDFVEMFVGVGASRVRDMFEQAKKQCPCIIFIDEIDAVGRHRGAGLGGGNDEREQTLNQLLVEMDGFDINESVIVIAATNRPDVLDPALLRPGRFDRQIVVPNPDVLGREKILGVHASKVPLSPDVDLKTIARGTPGFSGADLMNIVNEAALLAARRDRRRVSMGEFEDAKDKVMMGAERRSMVMSEDEKRLTAYHEAGHALVALKVPDTDPVHKATIIPRGRALGMVMQLPERDHLSLSYRTMVSRLVVMMGGRVAEEIVFGKDRITSGAASDISQATELARNMVTRWGFSDLLGTVAYGDNRDEVFLGHSVARQQNVSEETAQQIDTEVRGLIDDAYKRATEILSENRASLETLAQGLLEYETLNGDELRELLKGNPPERKNADPIPTPGSGIPTSGRRRSGGAAPKGSGKKRSGPFPGFKPQS